MFSRNLIRYIKTKQILAFSSKKYYFGLKYDSKVYKYGSNKLKRHSASFFQGISIFKPKLFLNLRYAISLPSPYLEDSLSRTLVPDRVIHGSIKESPILYGFLLTKAVIYLINHCTVNCVSVFNGFYYVGCIFCS